MTEQDQLANICPLCGGDNQCAVAAGRPAESCWCQSVTIDPAALAKIPEAAVNQQCLCPACGRLQQPEVSKIEG